MTQLKVGDLVENVLCGDDMGLYAVTELKQNCSVVLFKAVQTDDRCKFLSIGGAVGKGYLPVIEKRDIS